MEALNMIMPLGTLGWIIKKLFLYPILLTIAFFMGAYFMKALRTIWRCC